MVAAGERSGVGLEHRDRGTPSSAAERAPASPSCAGEARWTTSGAKSRIAGLSGVDDRPIWTDRYIGGRNGGVEAKPEQHADVSSAASSMSL
jgi:hypothetical protein